MLDGKFDYKVGVDMVGGDRNPLEVIEYSIYALQRVARDHSEVLFVAAGPEKILSERLKHSNITYLDVNYTQDNDTNLIDIEGNEVRSAETGKRVISDPRAVIVQLLELERKGDIDAVFSSGNTGSLVYNGRLKLGKIEGLYRVPLLVFIPTIRKGKPALLLDVGAVLEDTTPFMLYQYALLGSGLYKSLFHKENPNVAIYNVGEEKHKGTWITRATYDLFSQQDKFRFVGNVEGREGIWTGKADVIVTNGEIGNAVLKSAEGVVKDLHNPELKRQFGKNPLTWLAAGLFVVGQAYSGMEKMLSPDKYSGAPLPLKKLLVKGHSTSSARPFRFGLENTIKYLDYNISNIIADSFPSSSELEPLKREWHEPFLVSVTKRVPVFKSRLKKEGFGESEIERIIQAYKDAFRNGYK